MGFEIQTNGRHLVKNHLKSGQKCPDFEWSGFHMVGTIAIAKARTLENRAIWNEILKKCRFQMIPLYSDGFLILEFNTVAIRKPDVLNGQK